jgi:hypothetical protein
MQTLNDKVFKTQLRNITIKTLTSSKNQVYIQVYITVTKYFKVRTDNLYKIQVQEK